MIANLGSRLKECRKKKGLTQQELADLIKKNTDLNLSRITIARYESGTREPEASILLALSDALDVPPSFLLGVSDFNSNEITNKRLKLFCEYIEKYTKKTDSSVNIENFLDALNNLMHTKDIIFYSENFVDIFSLLCNAILLNEMYPVPGNVDALITQLNKMIEDSNIEKARDLLNTTFRKLNLDFTNTSSKNEQIKIIMDAFEDLVTTLYTKRPNDPIPEDLKPLIDSILAEHNLS